MTDPDRERLEAWRTCLISGGVDPVWLDTTSEGVAVLTAGSVFVREREALLWSFAKERARKLEHQARADQRERDRLLAMDAVRVALARPGCVGERLTAQDAIARVLAPLEVKP